MTAKRRAILALTPLESRDTPSTMTYAPGSFIGNSGNVSLNVTFTGPNSISWITSPPTTPGAFASGTSTFGSNLKISLTGCGNIPGTPLLVGNTIIVDLNGQTLSGNLNILTGPCDDTVYVLNGTVTGSVVINTQAGNDNVVIGGGAIAGSALQVGQNLRINEGAGDDSVTFIGPALNVTGNCSINMGAGNNSYNLASQFTIGGNLLMQAGAGSDPVNVLGTATSVIGGNSIFTLGAGTNILDLPAGLIMGSSKANFVAYQGAGGSDFVNDGATITGALSVRLRGGADLFVYLASSPTVGTTAFIDGGAPNNADIYIQNTVPTWTNTVINFP